MTWAKTETIKRTSNVRTQAVTKALVRREVVLVICLKGGKYSSANKPLSECVL